MDKKRVQTLKEIDSNEYREKNEIKQLEKSTERKG